MMENNELTIHLTMYLYPNIFLNSEVLSSFEIDEKAIKTSDYFNTTRYVNGPLDEESEEWSDPANQWKDFIKHILDYAVFFKFTQEGFERVDDDKQSRVEIKLNLNDELKLKIVLELRISDNPFDPTFPEEAKAEVLKSLAIPNVLSPKAGEVGVFEIEKVIVDSETFRFYLDAGDYVRDKIYVASQSLYDKGIDETELISSYKTVSNNEMLKTANSLMDRFDEAFKELAK